MWPFAAAAKKVDPSAVVGLMRYRYRGWNGAAADPSADLRVVLDRLPSRITRVVLVGHSMGGRAVVAQGNHPKVVGVLGLAPWLPENEPSVGFSGPVVFAHGDRDRITSPALTASFADRLRLAGTPVGVLRVEGEQHAMLNRAGDWTELVRRFIQHTLGSGDTFVKETLTTELARSDALPRWTRSGAVATGVLDTARGRLSQRIIGHL